MVDAAEDFLETAPLVQVSVLRKEKALLPKARGLYGLFFARTPGITPTRGCLRREGLDLLYIGTAGADLRLGGNLRNRLGDHHLGGNERRSTLCQTLAALLPDLVGPSVQQVERGKVKFHTGSAGRQSLRQWMDANIFVCWTTDPDPARLEETLVHRHAPPLNLDFSEHPFHYVLADLRNQRRQGAVSRA